MAAATYPAMLEVYAPRDNGDPEFWRCVVGIEKDRVKWMTFGNSGVSFDTFEDWQAWAASAVIVSHPVTSELK